MDYLHIYSVDSFLEGRDYNYNRLIEVFSEYQRIKIFLGVSFDILIWWARLKLNFSLNNIDKNPNFNNITIRIGIFVMSLLTFK
jgi:hypothetical protein